MPVQLYDTATLIDVIRVQRPPSTYWLDLAFPRELQFDTQDILFDQVSEFRNLAPFVAPNVQGRVIRARGYSTKSFRPAYIKPKSVINPSQAIARMAGEALLGGMSLNARYDALVAESLGEQKRRIMRTWEWMAAQAVITGAVVVAGEDYPTTSIAFGRHASLDVTLLTTLRWSQNTGTPLKDIETLRRASFTHARTPITRLTFGLAAWDYFVSFASVADLLKADIRGSTTDFNRAISAGEPFEFRGILAGSGGAGRLELWTYNDMYDDADDTAVPFLDENTVIGTGPGLQGFRCFGAIQDKGAQLQPLAMFPKMWESEDPAATYTMTQSAPLMVPAQPNGSFRLKVH